MFCSMSGVGIKHSLKQLLCCSIKNVCNHQTCPKAPKLLFSLSIQWFLFKQKKRNCAAWTKPEHISPSISQDLRRDALLLPCSPRAVSHPSFLVQCHCVAAAAGCLPAGAAHPGESCWANKLVCWDSRGQDFSPFNANSLELGFNFVQWTYGRQGSICLIASGLCQPGSYSFNKKKKSCSWTFWGPHYLSQVGLHSFPVGMWDLLPLFYNETSSNKKASTFPEAIYMNCKASSSGYKVPIMR